MMDQAKWLQEVDALMSSPVPITMTALKRIQEEGEALPRHQSCDSAISELKTLQSVGAGLENRALACLDTRYDIPLPSPALTIYLFICCSIVLSVFDLLFCCFCLPSNSI